MDREREQEKHQERNGANWRATSALLPALRPASSSRPRSIPLEA